MHNYLHHDTFMYILQGMTRTTIAINEHLLKQVRDLSGREHQSLGHTLSELVSLGLSLRRQKLKSGPRPPFRLRPFAMGQPRVDILDMEALYRVLDGK
jgi:hypothetical protein